ncbi:MAG TPA: glycosyltransferase family 4 protein [Kribbella sp.]|nr:glycosyltransferase family 4 protein [Kribbella sp.]
MRIALVCDSYLPRLGGIELHVHDLAVQLSRAAHSVVVITATGSPEQLDDVAVIRLPAVRTLPTPGALADLRQIVAAGPYDVVHVHMSLFSPLAWSAARAASAAGVPTVVTMHSLPAAGGVVVPRMLAWLDDALGAQVEWTAVSEVVAESLQPSLPARTVRVLHNGIDPLLWRPGEARRDRPLTIVSTMRLTRRKRPAALLRTLAAIRRLVPAEVPLRAVIVGAGPRAAGLARTVEQRRLADWVELPGRLTRAEIRCLYTDADVYLAPAELESFGVAALEARCAGLAVVAMASGGVGEFVRHGVEGFLVDGDEAMARATADLLTTPEVMRRIQEHNRTTEPVMTWVAVTDRHLRLYRLAALRPGSRALGSEPGLSSAIS